MTLINQIDQFFETARARAEIQPLSASSFPQISIAFDTVYDNLDLTQFL